MFIIYIIFNQYFFINYFISYLPFISLSLFSFSLVFIYLDDWKFSNNIIIKYIQIFSFFLPIITTIFLIYNNTYHIDLISYIKDNENNISVHSHVTVNKAAGQAIGQGLSTTGS